MFGPLKVTTRDGYKSHSPKANRSIRFVLSVFLGSDPLLTVYPLVNPKIQKKTLKTLKTSKPLTVYPLVS